MATTYPFADSFKQLFDFNQLFSAQRRNIEALSAANQVMVEGVQAVSRRQAEVLRDNVEQVLKASRDIFQTGSAENNLGRQTECARSILENNINSFREVTETLTKSSFEALDVLNKRAAESMDEINKTTGTAASRSRRAA